MATVFREQGYTAIDSQIITMTDNAAQELDAAKIGEADKAFVQATENRIRVSFNGGTVNGGTGHLYSERESFNVFGKTNMRNLRIARDAGNDTEATITFYAREKQ